MPLWVSAQALSDPRSQAMGCRHMRGRRPRCLLRREANQGPRPAAGVSMNGKMEMTTRPAETALVMAGASVAVVSAAERERQELQCSMTMAMANQRVEMDAFNRAMGSCKRPRFAAQAVYAFPRGGATVSGPSVKLARELARCWRNLRAGYRVLDRTDEAVHLLGYAVDLEGNVWQTQEDRFPLLIQRKVGKGRNRTTKWVVPDERDARELIGRRGAKLERNCILRILPPDLIEEAMDACRHTAARAATGDINTSREDTQRALLATFAGIGVDREAVERHLGHKVEMLTGDELADLRRKFSSISDGQASAAELFPSEEKGGSGMDPSAPAPEVG